MAQFHQEATMPQSEAEARNMISHAISHKEPDYSLRSGAAGDPPAAVGDSPTALLSPLQMWKQKQGLGFKGQSAGRPRNS
jgi:hypothetical protein